MLRGHQGELQGFFLEDRRPIWRPARRFGSGDSVERYGHLDLTQFNELELRLYTLIKSKYASKWELETCYTLNEALKLYALYTMDADIERAQAEEMKNKAAQT